VAPRDQVDKEYYTITASGVVYCPGDPKFETEFIPIGEWLRETSIYNLMRTLKFFKCLRMCTSMSVMYVVNLFGTLDRG
jgi:dynein heavy chain